MKIKLLFLLLIVLLMSCGKKTVQGSDYLYYKSEMEKAKQTQQQEEENAKIEQTVEENKVVSTPMLSADQRLKFSKLLDIPSQEITNDKLYHTINNWLGTPYLWGGETKRGIDCSAFVRTVYADVYEQKLPRTSIEQFYLDTKAHFKDQQYLQEGDLVFFRLRHKDKVVSHVGIYLKNGKFLGSNSPRGVEIANLNSSYWQDKYVASARLLKQ